MNKRNQFLLFPLQKKQSKPVVYNAVHIHYSKHRISDVEQLQVPHIYTYGKVMTTQKKPIPPVPPAKKAR